MEEVLASFIKFTQRRPNSRFNSIAHTIEDKCNILLNPETFNLHRMLEGIKNLWDNESKETYHLIDYHTLCNYPQETIEGIYKFLDIPLWDHRFTNLDQAKELNYFEKYREPDKLCGKTKQVNSCILLIDCSDFKEKYSFNLSLFTSIALVNIHLSTCCSYIAKLISA